MSRVVGRLSARTVQTAKLPKGKKKHLLPDGGCLYLEIVKGKEGLCKSWLFNYQLHHRRRFMGLGALHTVSLAEAREQARLYRQDLIKGIDPLDAKRERARAAIAERAKAVTFQECAEAYMRLHGDGWSKQHALDWESSLRRFVYPRIGELAPAKIDSAIVMNVIAPLWKVRTVTASRTLDRIAMVLDYATTTGYRSGDNPARLTRTALPKQAKITKVEHFAALPFDLVPEFMARLRAIDTPPARGLEMLILTTSRVNELLIATWSEIDFAEHKWNRPASHTKGGEDHTVPLPDRAIAILKAIGPGNPQDRIFQFGERSLGRLVDRFRPEGVPAVPHGFRSAFRQWQTTRTNYPDHIAEMQLAHKVPTAVIKAYKRKAEPFEKRVRMMAQWATFCCSSTTKAVEADNVVEFGAR